MTPAEWISLLNAVGTFLVGAAALWGVAISLKGVKVSTGNKVALAMVQTQQNTNKLEIKEEISAVRHDIRNGGGVAIATAVVKQIKPVLAENNKIVTTEVARSNAEVAAVLADQKVVEGGVDRRGQEKETI